MNRNIATNVRIPASTYHALKVRSLRDGRPVAWHIREALERYLDQGAPHRVAGEEDPFDRAIGIGASGLGDLAEEHDHHLYGWPKQTPRRRRAKT